MPNQHHTLSSSKRRIFQTEGLDCPFVDYEIRNLSDYLAVFSSLIGSDDIFWFRGHADYRWLLIPSALRYKTISDREKALGLISCFKRYAEMKIERPPELNDELRWTQLAQHYGLPTRLLDWTENAAVALYFACQKQEQDGCIVIINPVDLNKASGIKTSRILDYSKDAEIINEYFFLDGKRSPRNGKNNIAIYPIWNSPRITIQQGAFTLHGSNCFSITPKQSPSLVHVPILKQYKKILLNELDRFGISEMTIFPEIDRICNYIKCKAKLDNH